MFLKKIGWNGKQPGSGCSAYPFLSPARIYRATARFMDLSAASAGRFGFFGLFGLGATCTVFVGAASSGVAPGHCQTGPCDQPGNAQAGNKFLQIFFVHRALLMVCCLQVQLKVKG
jgi:hypothetical protein